MESWMQSWRPRTIAFCDFSTLPVQSTAPATKKWGQVIRSAAPVRQNHLPKTEDLMLQNATPLRKSAPGLPHSFDEHVSWTAPATENVSFQILLKCLTPAIIFGNATKPSRFAHFWQGAQSLAPATRNDIWTSKSDPNLSVFYTFDSKCASRHNRLYFSTSQLPKVPEPVSFFHFWLGNVLRATTVCTFSTSQLPKVPEPVSFLHFWLGNVLRATMACTFSTCQLPKVVRAWYVLYILTSKCASRHNGVHFFDMSTSKSGPEHGVLCTFWLPNVLRATTACNFSSLIWPHGSAPAALASLLVDPPEPQIIGKTQWLSYLFAPLDLLSSETFFFLMFCLLLFSSRLVSFRLISSRLFSSLLFSSRLWLFPSLLFICPYCRKFDF